MPQADFTLLLLPQRSAAVAGAQPPACCPACRHSHANISHLCTNHAHTQVWHIGGGSGGGGFNPNCTNGTTPPLPPPPPSRYTQQVSYPVYDTDTNEVLGFRSTTQCLIANGSYPCWRQPPSNWSVCALTVGSCEDPTAWWSVENGGLVSFNYSGAAINIDCDQCGEGRVAKMFSAGTSGLHFNASSGQIQVTSCPANATFPGMCLTNGIVSGEGSLSGGDR